MEEERIRQRIPAITLPWFDSGLLERMEKEGFLVVVAGEGVVEGVLSCQRATIHRSWAMGSERISL